MAITFERINPFVMHMTWTNKITYREINDAIRACYDSTEPLNEQPFVTLIDLRSADLPSIDFNQLRDVFKIQKLRGSIIGMVLVGASPLIHIGGKVLTNVFQQNVAVANTLEAAFDKACAMRDAYFAERNKKQHV